MGWNMGAPTRTHEEWEITFPRAMGVIPFPYIRESVETVLPAFASVSESKQLRLPPRIGCPSGGSDNFVWPRGTSIVSGRPRIESRADSRLNAPLSQSCQLESGGQSSCFGVGVCVVAHHRCRSLVQHEINALYHVATEAGAEYFLVPLREFDKTGLNDPCWIQIPLLRCPCLQLVDSDDSSCIDDAMAASPTTQTP
uniref:Uncharacterized protein n=1 Tax=Timema douglasi TaxID=61478 RepID=A0A7R8Z7F4_TIMDO|nr:unnamed protein product [Timema douglasi]